jgi:predicted glutamine amidotransferase
VLTFGLQDDPPAAVEQAIGLVGTIAGRHGVPHPFQGTIATTDGERIWAFRYSSERNSHAVLHHDARLIVSEPLGDVAGVWNEVPESARG